MPRSYIDDVLMPNKFHLYDVSLTVPPVFFPIYGFSAISSPEVTAEYMEIKEGNFEYPRKIFKGASVNSVVLERGAKLQDSDFWQWMTNYIEGKRDKKNLMIIQFTNVNGNIAQKALGAGLGFVTDGDGSNFRTPGRAWILRNCSPKRYIASTDFDANASEPSIQSLEVEYEFFVEFNMGTTG